MPGFVLVDRNENERRYTFTELWKGAQRMAAQLKSVGVHPKDRVSIVLPTSEEFLDAFFGCHLAGAVPVPMYPPVRLGRMDEYLDRTTSMLQQCETKAIVTNSRINHIVGHRLSAAIKGLQVIDVANIVQTAINSERPPPMPSQDDVALIQFTSGSTQDPKGVELTHAHILG